MPVFVDIVCSDTLCTFNVPAKIRFALAMFLRNCKTGHQGFLHKTGNASTETSSQLLHKKPPTLYVSHQRKALCKAFLWGLENKA